MADSQTDLYQTRQDSISDYKQFKIDAEQKIIAQEKKIAELKARIVKEKKVVKDDYEKKLIELENKNSDIKKKLPDYKDDGQDKWIAFKNDFDHDMDEMGKAYKDLIVDNVKSPSDISNNSKIMKNLLYVIAGLLVLIWIIVFRPSSSVHLWLAFAGLIVLIRIVFDKKLSNRKI